jgi:hypothetical protein
MKDWGSYATALLGQGSALTQYDPSLTWKHALEIGLNPAPTQDSLIKIQKTIQDYQNSVSEVTQSRVYQNIACRELAAGPPQGCQGLILERPYDSANFQLKTPLFYFQGELDPSTFIKEARYHYDHQLHASKYFVTFKQGGHNVLQNELGVFIDLIFQKIATHSGFEQQMDILKSIGTPITVEKKIHH